MKEVGGKTNKDIVFYNDDERWQTLVRRCEDLTRENEARRAVASNEAHENYWRKHATPDHTAAAMDDAALSEAMQAEINKGGFGR